MDDSGRSKLEGASSSGQGYVLGVKGTEGGKMSSRCIVEASKCQSVAFVLHSRDLWAERRLEFCTGPKSRQKSWRWTGAGEAGRPCPKALMVVEVENKGIRGIGRKGTEQNIEEGILFFLISSLCPLPRSCCCVREGHPSPLSGRLHEASLYPLSRGSAKGGGRRLPMNGLKPLPL